MAKSGAAWHASSKRPIASPWTRLNARAARSYAPAAASVAPERRCPWASSIIVGSLASETQAVCYPKARPRLSEIALEELRFILSAEANIEGDDAVFCF